jgi:hypothetical protein
VCLAGGRIAVLIAAPLAFAAAAVAVAVSRALEPMTARSATPTEATRAVTISAGGLHFTWRPQTSDDVIIALQVTARQNSDGGGAVFLRIVRARLRLLAGLVPHPPRLASAGVVRSICLTFQHMGATWITVAARPRGAECALPAGVTLAAVITALRETAEAQSEGFIRVTVPL